MAKIPSKVTKRLRIDFKGAKGALKERIKQEVGELTTEEILRHLSDSKSPVKDGKYKKQKKDKTNADLFEEGDLYTSVNFETYRDGIEVGVFDSKEVPKAYGHNTGYKGHPTIPEGKYTREFIPKKEQEFKKTIQNKIKKRVNEILKESKDASQS